MNDLKSVTCGLLGEHLGHSFSPQIHRELADYPYALYEVERESLGTFLKETTLTAFNVTIPYKKDVIPYMDELSDAAKRIGAVNTVTRLPNGGFCGDNTDYYGFSKMVEASGVTVKDKKVLVLGTGGASVTVRTVLADMGAADIVSVSRTGAINYENVYTLHADADVVVNTTPVGMYPNTGASPLRLSEFKHLSGVLDLIYNPARTALLLEAERLGIPFMNGLLMLVAQAKRACELFLGTTIDDAAGEAFDKCAKVMGLPYPGGPVIDRLAQEGDPKAFRFAKPHIPEFDYSFSGLKTSFLYTLRDEVAAEPNFVEEHKADLCASLQHTIIEILLDKVIKASKATGIKDIAIAGGVSANSGLRNALVAEGKKRGWRTFLPEFRFTTDNAAMIALAGYYRYMQGELSSLDVAPVARLEELEGLNSATKNE